MNLSFFYLLDLERPGLEKVKLAVDQGEDGSAAEALLQYMRSRSNPIYLEGWDNREIDPEYDTTEADRICNREILRINVGKDIDWKMDPVGDPEWSWALNRHEHFTTLGRAYWYTGEEKYAKECIEQWLDWIVKNPPLDAEWMISLPIEKSQSTFEKSCSWRPLSAGIRMYTAWIPCFLHFLNSTHFTAETMITILSSIADHARYLRTFYTHHAFFHYVSGNWGIMESNGLAHIGIMFPEFKESKAWRERALSRLEDQIRSNINADGVLDELASGYHLVTTFSFLQIAELAERNDYRISAEYYRKLEKMIDFCMGIMKPHGVYPMLSDGDEGDVFGHFTSYGWYEDLNNCNALIDSNDLRYVFKAGAKMFDRPDWLYVATHGKQGERPQGGSAVFPVSGYYAMRSGWDHEDKYLVFDCGMVGDEITNHGHGHCDALSFDCSAFGETLVIDPGRYIYTEDPFRHFFKGTAAHNTVRVDDMDQSEMLDSWGFGRVAEAKANCWSSGEKCDFIDATHDGYTRLDRPILHRRRILFVKDPGYWVIEDELTGEGKHDLDVLFHFGPAAVVQVDEKTRIAEIEYPNRVGLKIVPVSDSNFSTQTQKGEENPPRGWVSYDYGIKEPAPMLTYTKEQILMPQRFAFLLFPWKQNRPELTVRRLDNGLSIRHDATTDVVSFSQRDPAVDDEFIHDGECLFMRKNAQGILRDVYAVDASRIMQNGKMVFESDVKHRTIERTF